MRHLLPLVFVWFLLSVTGCAVVTKDWHAIDRPAPPLVAAKTPVVWQTRVSVYPFIPVPPVIEYRMLDPNGHPIDDRWLQDVATALRKTPMWDQWPKISPGERNLDRRHAPFEFVLVSLRPTIVVVWPSSGADTESWYESRLGRLWNSREPFIPGLDCQIFRAALIPPRQQLFWFSPDLDHMQNGFHEVEMIDATHMRIVLPDGELLLEIPEPEWRVTPVKRGE